MTTTVYCTIVLGRVWEVAGEDRYEGERRVVEAYGEERVIRVEEEVY